MATMAGGGSPTWLMDAISVSDGTIGGTAKILVERMELLPANQKPEWMLGKTKEQTQAVIAQVLVDALQTSFVAKEYMDRELEKGKAHDEAYSQVKQYVDASSRPLTAQEASITLLEAQQMARHTALAHAPSVLSVPTQQAQRDPSKEAQVLPPQQEQVVPPAVICADPAVSTINVREPLLVVGTCNGFNLDIAKSDYWMDPVGASDSTLQESMLRVPVHPEAGVDFQILSAKRLWDWRLYPGGDGSVASMMLVEDQANGVFTRLAVGKDADELANQRFFHIPYTGATVVTVKVLLSNLRPPMVWYSQVAG